MKTALTILLALGGCNTPSGSATASSQGVVVPDPGEKVLSVNGKPIGLNELELVFKRMRVPEDKLSEFAWTSGGKKYAEDYALAVVMSDRAIAEGLRDDRVVQQQLALAERQILAAAMRDKLAKAAVTDAAINEFYEKNKARFEKPEVHVRLIRVPTEPEAREILERLKKGEDFAALAKEKSKDATASKGGDAGWIHEKENATFGEQAFAAEKGAVLGPIASAKTGFYIVEVLDKRDKTPMEEVRPEASAQIEHAESTRVMDETRKAMAIEWVKEPSNEPMPGMPPGHGMPRGLNPHMGPGAIPMRPGGPPGAPPAAPHDGADH